MPSYGSGYDAGAASARFGHEQFRHCFCSVIVYVAYRLVEDEEVGGLAQHPDESHSLLLAERQESGAFVCLVCQSERLKQRVYLSVRSFLSSTFSLAVSGANRRSS